MNSKPIFVPQKIRVGFDPRKDTYSGVPLAYVVYYDEKGKIRKEPSLESWRDKSIPTQEFDNVPTIGFVLNKKVGDYKSDWNHRRAWVRVFDPRQFEFEIEVDNLLYILENTSSIVGKGLEGEFVYGWANGNLVLVPTSSSDYKEIAEYTKARIAPDKITSKTIIPGCTYSDRKNHEYIYLGYFDCYHWVRGEPLGKQHVFFDTQKSYWPYAHSKSLSKFIRVISKEPVYNYAELMDDFESSQICSPIDKDHTEYISVPESDIASLLQYSTRKALHYNGQYHECSVYKITGKDNAYCIKYYDERTGRWIYSKNFEGITAESLVKVVFRVQKYLENGKPLKE